MLQKRIASRSTPGHANQQGVIRFLEESYYTHYFGVFTMHQIHPDQGLVHQCIAVAQQFLKYRLFTNNLTLSQATVYSDFVEASGGGGYAAVTYDEGDFTLDSVAAHIATITAADVVFSVSSGSQSIYGYYVTDSANTKVLACGKFSDAPRTLDASNPISIPAKWALQGRYAS